MSTTRTRIRTGAALAVAVAAGAIVAPAAQAAGPFTAPQTVTPPWQRASSSDLAVGPGGAAAVLFSGYASFDAETDTFENRVYASVHEQGALPSSNAARGFGAAVPLSPSAETTVLDAKAAVDSAGNVTAVLWTGTDIDSAVISTRYKPVGGAWQPAQVISPQSFVPNSQNIGPELTVTPDGRAFVLTDAGLFERAPGASTFTAVPDSSDVVDVAVSATGTLAAASSTPTYSVRVLPAGGTWGPATELGLLDDSFPFEADRSSIAITDDGTVVAAWDEGGPDATGADAEHGLNVSVRTPAGTWSTEQNVNATDGGPFGTFAPIATASGNSTVLVSWSEFTGEPPTGSTASRRTFPGGTTATSVAPFVDVAFSASGRALATVGPTSPGSGDITAQVRPSAGAAFGAPVSVIAPSGTATRYAGADVGLDAQGNGYVSWQRTIDNGDAPNTYAIGVTGYDPVAPVITSASVPAAGKAGASVAVSATATDRMSVPTYAWNFGDGKTATGASVSHTYASAGTYAVKVTATDEAGNSSTSTKSVVVSAAALPKVDALPTLWTPSYAGGKTLVRTLELSNLKAGDKVSVRCDGGGCNANGFKSFTVTAAQATGGKLVTPFGATGLVLSTGASLKVIVGRAGALDQTAKFTMNAGKAPTRLIWYAS